MRTSAPTWESAPLFRLLVAMLAPAGAALLSFDRRAPEHPGADTPIEIQSEDAQAAAEALRERIDSPVGFFGFSQGAWVRRGFSTALLPGCRHWPATGSGEPGFDHDRDDVAVSPALGAPLRDWLAAT